MKSLDYRSLNIIETAREDLRYILINYSKEGFNYKQLELLKEALSYNIHYGNIIANKDLNHNQMREIFYGLQIGLNIDKYKNPSFSAEQMRILRYGLIAGVDISSYANPELSEDDMLKVQNDLIEYKKIPWIPSPLRQEQINIGIAHGVDVSFYNNRNYNADQMREIRLGLEKGLNVYKYLDYSYPAEKMRKIRLDLEEKLLN